MSLKCQLLLVMFALMAKLSAQDYFSFGGGNYSGLQQVIANPASAADNRLKLDVILGGLDLNFNNSWFGIKRSAVDYSGKITKPGSVAFPATWRNLTPNVENNLFKNFVFSDSKKDKGLYLEGRILLPSVLFQINEKNTLAFTWSVRQFLTLNGLSQPLATLFEKEFDLSVTQNNLIQNKNLSALQITWAEYGFTYARVISNKNKHFLKAGITPKILQGLEGASLVVSDLEFLFSTKDTNSYLNADFTYARSANLSSPYKNQNPVSGFYHRVARPRVGLDIGIVYEWRPHFQKFRYRPDGKNYAWRKDLNKYKLRLGASLNDLGKIYFNKQGATYDLSVQLRRSNFTKYTSQKNFSQIDSLARLEFNNQTNNNRFYIGLPVALNLQADYALNKFIYLNLSSHVSGFNKSNLNRLYNHSAICFAPRIEHYWFDVSTPLTFNTLSAKRSKFISTGLNIRIGPVTFGSNDVIHLFKGDVYAMNFFVVLRCAIPYKLIYDQDKDGVKDRKDICPDDPGEPNLKGCPDKDHDNIPDKDDQCPGQAGIAAFNGCPDTDGDGIKDAEDACPKEKGTVICKGCPDNDKDSIANKDDDCPGIAGLKKFKGCPDSDKDGIPDKEDLCPTKKGEAKYKGCPDTDNDLVHDGVDACPEQKGPAQNKGCPWPDKDKDGIPDRQDSCMNLPGTAEFFGCPPPVKLEPEQKKVVEKAYSNLEFASGKDKIKPSSYNSLNALADLLMSQQADWKIKISGHADNVGSENNNLLLSEKRARAVQKYLIKRGLPPENIIVEWFGDTRQIADNTSKSGKQKNRRVEMLVLLKEN